MPPREHVTREAAVEYLLSHQQRDHTAAQQLRHGLEVAKRYVHEGTLLVETTLHQWMPIRELTCRIMRIVAIESDLVDRRTCTGRVPDDVPEFVDAITDALCGTRLLEAATEAPASMAR